MRPKNPVELLKISVRISFMILNSNSNMYLRKSDVSIGGSKKMHKSKYEKDGLVYAKCMKYPPWPAKVINIVLYITNERLLTHIKKFIFLVFFMTIQPQ